MNIASPSYEDRFVSAMHDNLIVSTRRMDRINEIVPIRSIVMVLKIGLTPMGSCHASASAGNTDNRVSSASGLCYPVLSDAMSRSMIARCASETRQKVNVS